MGEDGHSVQGLGVIVPIFLSVLRFERAGRRWGSIYGRGISGKKLWSAYRIVRKDTLQTNT